MNRNVLIGSAALVLILVVAVLASPLLSLQGLRDAFVARDPVALAAHLDEDRLLSSFERRLRAQAASSTVRPQRIEALTARLVAPAGLIAAVCDAEQVSASPSANASRCAVESTLGNLRFESINRYSAALTRDGAVVATIVMDRSGTRWRLVDLVLPPSAYQRLQGSVWMPARILSELSLLKPGASPWPS